MKICRFVFLLAVLCCALTIASARLEAQTWRVQVHRRTGGYTLTNRAAGWSFTGTTGTALSAVQSSSGRDRLGAYRSTTLRWTGAEGPMRGEIRIYRGRPVAQFRLTFVNGAHFTSGGARPAFPNFQQEPAGLHVFSYADKVFSPPLFGASQTAGPWVLFNKQLDAVIIAPANHFQVVTMVGDGSGQSGVAPDSELTSVPTGFQVDSLVVFRHGIHNAFTSWGDALTTLEGRARASNEADDSLRYLGYWTDNGATYYYHYRPDLGYEGTLLAELQHLRQQKIPVRYLQLDSWWYQKDPINFNGRPLKAKNPKFRLSRWNVYGGVWRYRASPALFPKGLEAFHSGSGMPFVVHGRWISQRSPYHQRYTIAGIAPVDARYWNHIAQYLHDNGVVTYEQDWLNIIRQYSDFSGKVGLGDQFFTNMAKAMAARHMTLQYCMPEPNEILEESRFSNLTTSRVSDDHFVRARWYDFLFTSQFAGAMGAWPWADVTNSPDDDSILLQTLSAGPVGFGDGLGKESRANILPAARADGVLIKPDAPLVPMDQSYLDGARGKHVPTLGVTYTDHQETRTAYVFAFARRPQDEGPVRFTAADVGLKGGMYVYDYFSRQATWVPAGQAFTGKLGENDASYYVCASPDKAGIALLGDSNAYVGTGKTRMPTLSATAREVRGTVKFAQGETSVELFGFAARAPHVHMARGHAGKVNYDASTREFTVRVEPAAGANTAEVMVRK